MAEKSSFEGTEMSLFHLNGDVPFVSVIIVNYNGRKNLGPLLDECVESVLKMKYPKFEVVFVDNASTDDSIEYIRRKYDFDSKLKVVELNKNYGWVGGVNRAYEYAQGNVLAILNTDVVVTPEWLGHAIYTLLRNKNAVIVTPKLTSNIAIAGGEIDIMLVSDGRPVVNTEIDAPCFFPSGAAFVVDRKFIEIFGEVFDDDYFAYYDDVDLGWRCQLLRLNVLYCPTSIAFHKHGGSFGVTSPFKFYLMRKNALDCATKNVSTFNVLKLLPLWLLSTIYAAYLFYRSTGNTTYLFTGVRIIRRYLAGFRKIWEKHVRMQAIRKVDDDEIFSKFRKVLFVDNPNSHLSRLALAFVKSWLQICRVKCEIVGLQRYPTFDLIKIHSADSIGTPT